LDRTKDRYFYINPLESKKPLLCYSDAGWGSEFQRSSYGLFISFYGAPILWIARRLHTVAELTCQAEYMALGMATRQLLWVQQLIEDILGHWFISHLICDNKLEIKVSKDDTSNKQTRHTKREFFITNQTLYEGETALTWTSTDKQLADIMTKALKPERHNTLAQQVLGASPIQQGGC
jgi:hypothetical protein